MMLDKLAFDVLAKFKRKKKLENGTVVYMYSEKQVADRNRRKARRLEKLRKNIKHLRAQVKKDLTSDDPVKALTALAVGLMDVTAERVGSSASAKGDLNEDGEPHFGVTTWTKKHISFGKGGATIKYTGKSGVKHEKKVTDPSLVKALRKAVDCVGKEDCVFTPEHGSVGGTEVNAYLKTFGITAKDLRGFHANSFMKEQLKAVRAKGGKLPEDKKEREKKLKAEFKEALEKAAKDVGHEPSTLRSQYLIPGLEESFMKDGTVSEKMTKEAYEVAYPAEDRDNRPLVLAGLATLDDPWVASMRKTFLTLMGNIPKIRNYVEARKVKDAFNLWYSKSEQLFDKQFLKASLKYDFEAMGLDERGRDYIVRKLTKPFWDLMVEVRDMPLSVPGPYASEQTRFDEFQRAVDAWDKRARKKAQVFWKEMSEVIAWYEKSRIRRPEDPEKFQVKTLNEDQLTLEGFQVTIRGYDPDVEYMVHGMEQIRFALRDYRKKAKERLPILIQKQLPMVIDFAMGLDTGGRYEGRHIRINGTSGLGKDSQGGLTKTLAHEMGHHIHKTQLSDEASALWNMLIRGDYGDLSLRDLLQKWPESTKWALDFADALREKDPILSLQLATVAEGYEPGGMLGKSVDEREDFVRMLESGTTSLRVPNVPITGYAGKNSEEAFCETIGLLVAYGPRAVHEKIRSWLDVVLPGQVKLASQDVLGIYCRQA